MSGRPSARRPATVTIVVLLTGVAAVIDIVVGVGALAAARSVETPSSLDLTADQTVLLAQLLGWVFIGLGVSQAVLAVLLARGVNAARLVLTLVLILRQAHAWFLVAELGIRRGEGFVGLAAAVVTVFLMWNPAASRFYDSRRDTELSGSLRQPHLDRVDGTGAVDHSGQPGGPPARPERRHPGVQVVRPGARPPARREPAGGCRIKRPDTSIPGVR